MTLAFSGALELLESDQVVLRFALQSLYKFGGHLVGNVELRVVIAVGHETSFPQLVDY